ncbi:MAG: nitroreductase family protein [Candidatus Nanohaloarchaea archaeon]
MEFTRLLRERKSVHSFDDREVSRQKVVDILETARFAPSAWNLQPWEVIVLDSEDSKAEAVASSYDQAFLSDADKILVIAGDERFDEHLDEALTDSVSKGYMTEEEAASHRKTVEEFRGRRWEWKELELTANCMFLASAVLNAAHERGLGACPVKGFDQEELAERLGLQQLYPILLIPIGYPAEDLEKKWRREPEDLIEFR